MQKVASSIPEDRSLTAYEREFVRWMLEHGSGRARSFLTQLEDARVAGRCACGCASINLAVAGVTYYGAEGFGKTFGMETLCEYRWSSSGKLFEAYLFACNGLLAGLDVWSVDGQATPGVLPPVSELVAVRTCGPTS